jgi:hypothetical protein
MPNPKRFKDEKTFMKECMHQLLHVEHKNRDQAIAQCMNLWRQKGKKCCLTGFLREVAASLIKGKYIREKGQGTPGQPGYKPTLWYWITPEGKKKLVDQKTME